MCFICVVSLQSRGSARRRTESVNAEDLDKPYICDSKETQSVCPEFIICSVTLLLSCSSYRSSHEKNKRTELFSLLDRNTCWCRADVAFSNLLMSFLFFSVPKISMQRDYDVYAESTSMPLLYLEKKSLRSRFVWRLKLMQIGFIPFFCFILFPSWFASVSSLFQIGTDKSINQKRLKKVSEFELFLLTTPRYRSDQPFC